MKLLSRIRCTWKAFRVPQERDGAATELAVNHLEQVTRRMEAIRERERARLFLREVTGTWK